MNTPPRIIHGLLRWLIRSELFPGVYGDLLEEYHGKVQKTSRSRANLWFLLAGLGFVRFPILFSKKENYPVMNTWNNYFKISFRNLLRHKANTAISLVGLVVSFTACLAMMQYITFEKSYDSFQNESLYRVTHQMTTAASTNLNANSFYAVAADLKDQVPEIEDALNLMAGGTAIFHINDSTIRQDELIFSTPNFFEIFNFTLLEGALTDDPSSIAISESVADRLFPSGSVIGRQVEMGGLLGQDVQMRIGAVYKDLPINTHVRAKVIVPMPKLVSIAEEAQFFGPNLSIEQVRWLWLSFQTYVRLSDGAEVALVEEKANQVVETNRKERNEQVGQKHVVFLHPVSDVHTTANVTNEMSPSNDLSIINLFTIVAVAVLIIGWINYINLSTARSMNRGREVGIRKVLGSGTLQLKIQFQTEAFILNIIAFIVALVLVVLVGPSLEELTGVAFFSTFYDNYLLLGSALFVMIIGSFLSGFYPAQILSRFRPVEILKGKFSNSGKGVFLRRILVGLQFAFTLFLLSGLMVVHRQMSFMLDHDLGIDISSTVIISNPPNAAPTEEFTSEMTTLRTEISQLAGVNNVAISSMAPGIPIGWSTSTQNTDPKHPQIFINRATIDHNFMELYRIPLIAGRIFDKRFGTENGNVVVNLNTVEQLGFSTPEDALGYDMEVINGTFRIVGVVDNFHQQGVQFAINPIMFHLDSALTGGFLTLKVEPSRLQEVMGQAQQLYQKFFPRAPYEQRIVEDVYADQYNSEARFRSLFGIFTSVAIIIAILGLLGLASFLLNQRLKEICVRKVLGARLGGLFVILNKEYFIICSVAFTLSIPFAVYMMKEWLNGFENRIELNMFYFILPLLITLTLIVLSTFRQTLKVLQTNPAQILKEED